jgi:glyoxylase-like metal-dependent hydrolase (beta-lactamase superfamily II)
MRAIQAMTLGYNSLYLVEDHGERVLVDAGPDYQGASTLLEEQLDGRTPELVAITHGHIDHAGLGAFWQQAGVSVAMGMADMHLAAGPALANVDEWAIMAGYIVESGAPPEVAARALHALEQRRDWAVRAAYEETYSTATRGSRWATGLRYEPYPNAHALANGDCLPAGLRVVWCPGHTPGNLVFVHESEGWLFSGDQLLPAITPTPAIQVDVEGERPARFRSLPHFVASLRLLRAMEFARCYPGHGEPFDNVADVIDANLAQVGQRGARVLTVLRGSGEATAYAIADALYPRALVRRFWQIIATVQGQLDLLEDNGLVAWTGTAWAMR